MTITTPSPEEFLAQASTDEDDQVEELGSSDPLESIAASLRRIADWGDKQEAAEQAEKQADKYLEDLEREYREIEALHDAKQALLDEVLAICKPSTSKLANAIRAVVEPGVAPPAEEDTGPVEPDAAEGDAS